MVEISFERLVSRSLVRVVSDELDLAGVKMGVNNFFGLAIIGGFLLFIAVSFIAFLFLGFPVIIAAPIGIITAVIYETALYAFLEYLIDGRKTFVENLLPEYLQLTAANIRSGVSLDKALISAARPEFKYFRDDILLMGKQLYSGETMEKALNNLSARYRCNSLKRTIRMMSEALRYGGGMADILNQISRDLRNQLTIQKEISGQLFMYTIFITFAAVIAAPVLFGITNKMISITDTIWGHILQEGGGGLGSIAQASSLSFLKPHPPTIQPEQYSDFSIAALVVISGLSALIVSAISSGSTIRGIRFVPLFIVMSIVIFFVVSSVFGALLGSVTGGV